MILNETTPFEYNIVESKSKRSGVLMHLEGKLQHADVKNANNRIYPINLWKNIVSDKTTNERIESRRMLGELDHPVTGATSTHRVSHIITEHKLLPNGEIRGKIEVLDTPSGRIVETLLKAGVQLGISSRGDGSVEQKGDVSEVQDDYRLETYDLVLNPSTPGAYPSVVESEQNQQNQELIYNAISKLANNSDDINVLLECYKLIDYSNKDSNFVIEKIKKISENNKSNSDNLKNEENDSMKTTDFSPEMTAFLKEQINIGVSEVVKEKDEKIGELNSRIVELSEDKDTLTDKLHSATLLVEDLTKEVEELKEASNKLAEIEERYDASCALLDEAVERLQYLEEVEKKLDASNQLLSASIDKHREESVIRRAAELLAGLDEAVRDKVSPFLLECNTANEVNDKYDSLSNLIETIIPEDTKEPLPTKQNRSISEDVVNTSKDNGVLHSNIIVNRLLDRLSPRA